MRPIAVLPTTASHGTAQSVFQVLRAQRLEYDVVPSSEFLETPGVRRAAMAIVLVRDLDIEALELTRLLRKDLVPTFLVVEELSESDEATLLHTGVYDVVRTTISPKLLGARLASMFHHVSDTTPGAAHYRFANVTVNPEHHEVRVDGRAVVMTRTEFRLLVLLAQQPDHLLGKDVLAQLLGRESHLRPHAVESHVSRIRTKITAAGGPRLIESVRGVGYRLRV